MDTLPVTNQRCQSIQKASLTYYHQKYKFKPVSFNLHCVHKKVIQKIFD